MCLHPEVIPPVPEITAKVSELGGGSFPRKRRVAKAAFPNGSRYMRLRDELGVFYQDEEFADLYPKKGQSAIAP